MTRTLHQTEQRTDCMSDKNTPTHPHTQPRNTKKPTSKKAFVCLFVKTRHEQRKSISGLDCGFWLSARPYCKYCSSLENSITRVTVLTCTSVFVFISAASWGYTGTAVGTGPRFIVLISHMAEWGGETRSIKAGLNLIDSCFKLTGEINCRMKHKQKPTKRRTNEQITKSDWWKGEVNWLLAPTSNLSLYTHNSASWMKPQEQQVFGFVQQLSAFPPLKVSVFN